MVAKHRDLLPVILWFAGGYVGGQLLVYAGYAVYLYLKGQL